MSETTTLKTLAECVADRKCRKGKADGITKHGAFWRPLVVEEVCRDTAHYGNGPITIRRAGGDGIGQSAADLTYSLDIRHYRDGQVRCYVERVAWHQNGSYSGAGTQRQWTDISDCTTVEHVIRVLRGGVDFDCGCRETVLSSDHEADLTSALVSLGLAECEPSPDEVA